MIRDRRLCAKRVRQQTQQGLSHPDTMLRLAHHSYTTPRRALCILLFPFFDLCANCEHAPEVRRHRRSSFPSSRARALICLPPLLLQARTNFVPPPLRCPQNGTSLLPPCGIQTLPSVPRRTSLGRRVHSSPLPIGVLLALHHGIPKHRRRSISAVSTRKMRTAMSA